LVYASENFPLTHLVLGPPKGRIRIKRWVSQEEDLISTAERILESFGLLNKE
jgi:hypothetical protein